MITNFLWHYKAEYIALLHNLYDNLLWKTFLYLKEWKSVCLKRSSPNFGSHNFCYSWNCQNTIGFLKFQGNKSWIVCLDSLKITSQIWRQSLMITVFISVIHDMVFLFGHGYIAATKRQWNMPSSTSDMWVWRVGFISNIVARMYLIVIETKLSTTWAELIGG